MSEGRFFARILAADIACPDCGTVHSLNLNRSGKYWDKLTSKFQCTQCKRSWMLGVLAWKPKLGQAVVTQDQTPNRAEAKQLREERWINSQGVVMKEKLNFSKDYANRVSRELCFCASGGGGLCKIHEEIS